MSSAGRGTALLTVVLLPLDNWCARTSDKKVQRTRMIGSQVLDLANVVGKYGPATRVWKNREHTSLLTNINRWKRTHLRERGIDLHHETWLKNKALRRASLLQDAQ